MTRSGNFSSDTKRMIAARSGYLCSFPDCFAPTSGPADDGSSVNIGEAAHISAAQPNGPRYDPTLTADERKDANNGIWMCRTHAALIDRDTDRYTVEVLRDWKSSAEDRADKLLGRPVGCSEGRLATVSPAARLGAGFGVLVEGRFVPYSKVIDPDRDGEKLTWFVCAFVIQFSLLKKQNLAHISMNHLVVTVHKTRDVPDYQPLFMAYPTEADLYYVDIDANLGVRPNEFRPNRFYYKGVDDSKERLEFPQSMVIDDSKPAQIALRINANKQGMFLVSVDAEISSGEDRELLSIMPPQWVIFEHDDGYDPKLGV